MNKVFFVLVIYFQVGTSVKLLTKNDNCPLALVFFEQAKLAKLITEIRGPNKATEKVVRAMVIMKVHTLTYDYATNEILFVEKSKPGTIWSTNGLHNATQLLHENNTSFDNIAVDRVTENIYFLDNNQGIGVCSRKNKPASCMFLIPKPAVDQNVQYNQLLLYPRQGVLFWTREPADQPMEVMIASMNGQKVRSFIKFEESQKLSNISLPDSLYVDLENSETHLLSVQDNPSENHVRLKIEHQFEVYCNDHHMEKYYQHHKHGTLESEYRNNSYTEGYPRMTSLLILENRREQKSNICKQFQCSGICVLFEADENPIAECIPIDDKYLKSGSIADFQVANNSKWNNSLIISNAVTLFILVCVLILIIGYKTRSSCKKSKNKSITSENQTPINEVAMTSV